MFIPVHAGQSQSAVAMHRGGVLRSEEHWSELDWELLSPVGQDLSSPMSLSIIGHFAVTSFFLALKSKSTIKNNQKKTGMWYF